ncbi:hypothetical protein [Saccharopolyspora terrae]|uniref:hypothetical protein n=1 Tax=Saccharopolyspora terrae TaxID=2530384 RepID=UPI0014043E26|nr:hypothetical protein [Saccharopolyspora terrae]
MAPACPRADDLANANLARGLRWWHVEVVDLRQVARELRTGDPVEFVTARDAAAARARESGDAQLADRIKKLRKPTTAAWAVNLLADREPGELRALHDLGERLRNAQRELRGDELRDLAAERTRLLDRLTARAVELAAERGYELAQAGREQISRTLTAALSDPEAAAEVQEATLTKPLEYSGFGLDDLAAAAIRRQSTAQKPRAKRPAKSSEDTGEAKLLELRHRLRDTEEQLDAASETLQRAEAACEEAQERCERLREELADADAELRDRRRDLKAARQEHERAVKAKDSASKALDDR